MAQGRGSVAPTRALPVQALILAAATMVVSAVVLLPAFVLFALLGDRSRFRWSAVAH